MFWSSLLIGALVALSVSCLWLSLVSSRPTEDILERMEHLPEGRWLLEEAERQESLFDRAIKPALQQALGAVGRLAPQRNVERLRHDLVVAGNPLTVTDFLGIKLLMAFMAGGLAFLLSFIRGRAPVIALFLALAMSLVGFYLPNIWLRHRISARKAEIIRALPDALDMLTICVDAGLGFESALLKIGEKWQNELAAEFSRVVAEIRVGLTRGEALRNMAARVDVPDVSSFVAVLLQADQLGLSIAKILHTQSAQLRVRRRQRAEEKARQAPIKMLFPLIFLIFPAMFAVVLGPSIPIFIEIFTHILK